ncbi:MAG: hypothetical protein ACOYL6_02710 [Bacteriovoracaceae bacterium]
MKKLSNGTQRMKIDNFFQAVENIPVKVWIAFALVCRIILAITYSTYNHPDEWYQTIEYSNLMWGKKATYSLDMFWHMRNLSWPWILSLVSRVAFLISPTSIWMQISSIQMFMVLIDFAEILLLVKLIEKWELNHKKLWIAFFLSSHFLLRDSTRPSQEHISSIFFYSSVACASFGYWFWAGLLTSLVGATKYASGMLSAGLYFCFLIIFLRKKINFKTFLQINLGVILGIALAGIADYVYYGIYYKSMWSYFYFLLYSGLSDKIFGHQSAIVHVKFLFSQWKVVHFCILFTGLLLVTKQIFKKYTDYLVLLLPTSIFILGNLLMRHKEGRFITQIEIALWLILAIGLSSWKYGTKWVPRVLTMLILLNVIFSISYLPGNITKPTFAYYQLPELIKNDNNICAAVVIKRPLGSFFLSETVPQGFWPLGKSDDIQTAMKKLPILWYQNTVCPIDQKVLIQTFKQDEFLTLGCEKLDTFGSYWFKCPSTILNSFLKQEVRRIFLTELQPFELPTPETPGQEMMEREYAFEKKENLFMGSFPDW